MSTLLPLRERALGDVLAKCATPDANFASSHSVASCPAFQWVHDVFSMTVQKLVLRIACVAWCSLLMHLAWNWSLKVAVFLANGHSKVMLMWEEAYQKSAWKYLCRTLWMFGFSVGISCLSHLKGPEARGTVVKPIPCLSFLSFVQPLQVPFQCNCFISIPLLIIWLQQLKGPPNFIALFLFLLCWWYLGQEP